ncbi:DUF1516 family protein [Oenococcus oeni]|uniref:DUF1516 family protein n=1 Tax=Oenococcus oeni TaxID=1247 RepID=UPI0010B909C0|nr:DUF1516 family protein [Oenococcus oeni]SYW04573.1 putative ABC-type Fe3+-siderophore transport system, permease component [Oenococcus oeni]SYW13609.1 putative ABC-type Fe3+-siderophore transport system, permease component [Oenococcus oeni]
MQIIIAIHIMSVIAIAVSGTAALILQPEKDKKLVLTTRIIYLPLFVSGLLLALKTAHSQPILTILKIAVALAFVALLEISFAHKIKKTPTKIVLAILAILFFLAALLGIMLITNESS